MKILLTSNFTRKNSIRGKLRLHEIIFRDHFSSTLNPMTPTLCGPASAPSTTVLPFEHFVFISCHLCVSETPKISQDVLDVSLRRSPIRSYPRRAPAVASAYREIQSFPWQPCLVLRFLAVARFLNADPPPETGSRNVQDT